ncbi:MAG: hypothetical protein HKL95_09035 [Phycisphaerae bacterium]|nr:hypothetical protein [Phycisphaerae bacterium]
MCVRKLGLIVMVLCILVGAANGYSAPTARVAMLGALGIKHWALVALSHGSSRILTRLPGFQDSNYGVSDNELAEVQDDKGGCVLRTFSLASGQPLLTVQIPGLRIALMKEGPVRGVVFTGPRAVFHAGTAINLLGKQFMVVVNLKTHSISRFPPPHGLRFSCYSAAVPRGLACLTNGGRVIIFLAKQAKFRLVGGLQIRHAWLVYVWADENLFKAFVPYLLRMQRRADVGKKA